MRHEEGILYGEGSGEGLSLEAPEDREGQGSGGRPVSCPQPRTRSEARLRKAQPSSTTHSCPPSSTAVEKRQPTPSHLYPRSLSRSRHGPTLPPGAACAGPISSDRARAPGARPGAAALLPPHQQSLTAQGCLPPCAHAAVWKAAPLSHLAKGRSGTLRCAGAVVLFLKKIKKV